MEIRQATEQDADPIRDIVERSFQASYALSPLDIETIIEVDFAAEPLTDRLDEDTRLMLVAEEDDELQGFVEGHAIDDQSGEIVWLHVLPTERGYGVGTKLFERILADLRERGVVDIHATVLAENQEGGEFFQQFEFESDTKQEAEFGENSFRVEIYREKPVESEDDADYTVPEGETVTVDGETRYIGVQESIAGDEGEFLFVFEDEELDEHFGFYCTNCGTFTDSVDGQGKVICEQCGNEHKPEEYDGSYL